MFTFSRMPGVPLLKFLRMQIPLPAFGAGNAGPFFRGPQFSQKSRTASTDELARSDFVFRRSCLRLPHSRLGYPRSGLSRSDFVLWHQTDSLAHFVEVRC